MHPLACFFLLFSPFFLLLPLIVSHYGSVSLVMKYLRLSFTSPVWFWKLRWQKVARNAAKCHGSTAKMYFGVFKIQGSSSNALWIFPSAVVNTYNPQKRKSFQSKFWKQPLSWIPLTMMTYFFLRWCFFFVLVVYF